MRKGAGRWRRERFRGDVFIVWGEGAWLGLFPCGALRGTVAAVRGCGRGRKRVERTRFRVRRNVEGEGGGSGVEVVLF